MSGVRKWLALLLWMVVAFLLGLSVSIQKRSYPFDPRSDQLDLNHPLRFAMIGGKPAMTFCSSRIVEVPFVHRNLPYPFHGRVLDVGYRESQIIYELASLGFETWGIDIRPPLPEFPSVKYIKGDVRTYSLPQGYFDIVIGLSTIEHIGMRAYGDPGSDTEGDRHAMRAMRDALSPHGQLILTVPFGKRGATKWYRVYDHAALQSLLIESGFTAETAEFWRQKGLQWAPVSWKEAEQADSITGEEPRGVACVVARP